MNVGQQSLLTTMQTTCWSDNKEKWRREIENKKNIYLKNRLNAEKQIPFSAQIRWKHEFYMTDLSECVYEAALISLTKIFEEKIHEEKSFNEMYRNFHQQI